MIREEFFPTSVFGKDVKLDNDKLAQDIVNWSNQDKGVTKNKCTKDGILLPTWHQNRSINFLVQRT